MKVLISAYACAPGRGSEPGVGWNVARQIAKYHDVYVVTRSNNRESIEEELRRETGACPRFVYFDLPSWARWWKRGQRGINLYYYLWQLGVYWKARQLHRDMRFEIVHHVTFVRYWTPSFLALLPVPFVWGPVGGGESAPRSFYSTFSIRGRAYEAARDLTRWVGEHDPFVRLTARRSRLALATTRETEARLQELGCQSVKVSSESALDEETVRSLGSELTESLEGLRFVSIGRLLHWKGFHLSLQAFATASLPGAEYWIVGDGPERDRLEEVVSEAGISDKVRFWGKLSRNDTLRRLQEAHVLVHPSLHDSGGWVCLEAMAAGKPVLCLDLGGPAMQVSDDAGMRVDARTPDQVIRDLAECMQRLARDSGLRRQMGQAGRARVRERYLWDRRGKEYGELYRSVADSEGRDLQSPQRARRFASWPPPRGWQRVLRKVPALERWLYERHLAAHRSKGKTIVHVLHIGKTGGTAIKEALKSNRDTNRYRIELHGHRFALRDVPVGDKVVFFLRDPITRFVSAFYSRKREGRPHYFSQWSRGERRAFAVFQTPDELALGLSSRDETHRDDAIRAMREIRHVKVFQMDWLESEEYLRSRLGDVLLIGFQERLEEAFEQLKVLLDLPLDVRLPSDPVKAHKNPEVSNSRLSVESISNLEGWYASDRSLYELCIEKAEEVKRTLGGGFPKRRFRSHDVEIAQDPRSDRNGS